MWKTVKATKHRPPHDVSPRRERWAATSGCSGPQAAAELPKKQARVVQHLYDALKASHGPRLGAASAITGCFPSCLSFAIFVSRQMARGSEAPQSAGGKVQMTAMINVCRRDGGQKMREAMRLAQSIGAVPPSSCGTPTMALLDFP